jgi:UDP-glucose 6-dehydrogenase
MRPHRPRDSMKRIVSVFGLGCDGSVTAACLAHQGHHVVGVDSNAAKTESLESGRSPIIEKGLEDLIGSARKDSRLSPSGRKARSLIREYAGDRNRH